VFLDDLVAGLRGAQLLAQLGDLRNVDPLVVEENRAVRALERRLELIELGLFVGSRDRH